MTPLGLLHGDNQVNLNYVDGNAISMFIEAGDNIAFAQGCNCGCRMGRGIALEVKRRLPEMYEIDQKTLPWSRDKLGTFTKAVYSGNAVGYNLYTQFSHSNESDMLCMKAVRNCFRNMFKDMLDRGIPTVIIPKIGAGLARGDWEEIEKVILEELPESLNVLVVNYK